MKVLVSTDEHRFYSYERRLTHLAWQIWWEGYPVDLRLIRETLQQTTNQLSERIRWFAAIRQLEEETSANETTENTERLLDFIELFTTTYLDSAMGEVVEPTRRCACHDPERSQLKDVRRVQ
jgi:hypothetical protein